MRIRPHPLRKRPIARRGNFAPRPPPAPLPVVVPPVRLEPVGLLSPGYLPDGQPFYLPNEALQKHTCVWGASGKGKSVMMALLVKQAIAYGYGVVVIDPHAEMVNELLSWMDVTGFASRRRVHLFDPGERDFVTCFNPLSGEGSHPSVVADSLLKVVERTFGNGKNINETPQIARLLYTVAFALCELGLSLGDILLLLDPIDGRDIRAFAINTITDNIARFLLQDYHRLCETSPKDARQQFEGPLNRIMRMLKSEVVRNVLSQTEDTIDLVDAMDAGDVFLVNVKGNQYMSEDAGTFLGSLLLKEFVEKAKRRINPTLPCLCFLDEASRFMNESISEGMDELRKFLFHFIFAQQRVSQLNDAGENVKSAVMTANITASFGGQNIKEATEVAENIFPLDLETPVQATIKPSVIGHKLVDLQNSSTGTSKGQTVSVAEARAQSHGHGSSVGTGATESSGTSSGTALRPNLPGVDDPALFEVQSNAEFSGSATVNTSSTSVSQSSTTSQATGRADSNTTSNSTGTSQSYVPIMADLASAVHSKENMLTMHARALRQLPIGVCIIAVGENPPQQVKVPLVDTVNTDPKHITAIKHKVFEADPHVISLGEAKARIEHRQQDLLRHASSGEWREAEDENYHEPYSGKLKP